MSEFKHKQIDYFESCKIYLALLEERNVFHWIVGSTTQDNLP